MGAIGALWEIMRPYMDKLVTTLIGGLTKEEDSVAASGDKGIVTLAVRKAAEGALGGDGDYAWLQVDDKDRLKTYDKDAITELTSIKGAVEIMDDWDETNRCAVNPIAGQVGVAAGTGVMGATVLRTTLATDDLLVTNSTLQAARLIDVGTGLSVAENTTSIDNNLTYMQGSTGIATGAPAVFMEMGGTRRDVRSSTTATDGHGAIAQFGANGDMRVIDDDAITELTSIKGAVEIMDDWDETNRCAVNPIAGQVGISANAGATGALTTRVVIANDDVRTVAVEDAVKAVTTELQIAVAGGIKKYLADIQTATEAISAATAGDTGAEASTTTANYADKYVELDLRTSKTGRASFHVRNTQVGDSLKYIVTKSNDGTNYYEDVGDTVLAATTGAWITAPFVHGDVARFVRLAVKDDTGNCTFTIAGQVI